jgi:NAD(P)-dependent dehydrogenase (short-subunit alcohol dehydrogenase family)
MSWHPRQLGAQTGRSFVVTGANSGIGLEAARELVGRGAHVVLAVRDTANGEQAAARLSGPARRAWSSSTCPTSTKSRTVPRRCSTATTTSPP